MPLVKRTVNPTHLCRQKLPQGIKNELECVTNDTLSGVINQLASLSQHAEDVFGELFSEANTFYGRASSLKDRIDKLSVKVTQLDSNVEEVSLIDINSRKAFKSAITTDQQVVSRQSLPRSIQHTYQSADAPPPLQELNQFRDDGKDGLKIYTDPDYFFDLWREAIQKETREAREKRREQRKRDRQANPNYMRKTGKVRQAVNTRMLKAQKLKHGAEFIDTSTPQERKTSVSQKPQKEIPPPIENQAPPHPMSDQTQQYNNHISPPPPIEDNGYSVTFPEPPPPLDDFEPPPPPVPENDMMIPPPPDNINTPPPPPPPPVMPSTTPNGNIPPPPPPMNNVPPPPPPAPPAAPGANEGGLVSALQNVTLKKSEPAKAVDGRSGLLQAIRLGINLKKVEEKERSAAPTSSGNDVASILARRIAVEFSDSEESDSTLASEDEWED